MKHRWIILIIWIVFIVSISSWISWTHYQQFLAQKANLEEDWLDDFQENLTSHLNEAEILAKEVFTFQINQPWFLQAMEQVVQNPEKADAIRQDMYQRLSPLYDYLKDLGFRQLHIHLPQAVSFLRMHTPEKYGDSLWKVRDILQYAQSQQTFVKGFEEGRIFNGFRFIFPIHKAQQFLGTIEITIALDSFSQKQHRLREGVYRLLVNDGVVSDKVWDQHQNHYDYNASYRGWRVDALTDDFDPTGKSRFAPWMSESIYSIEGRLAPQALEKIPQWQPFVLSDITGDSAILAAYIPLPHPQNAQQALLVGYTQSPLLYHSQQAMKLNVFITLTSGLVFILLIGALEVLALRSNRAEKRLMQELTDSHQHLQEAQLAGRLGSWRWDIVEDKVTWSEAAAEVLNLPQDKLPPNYQSFFKIVHPEDIVKVQKNIQAALDHHLPYRVEHRILLPGRRTGYVSELGRVFYNEAGKPTHITGSIQDISDSIYTSQRLQEDHLIIEKLNDACCVLTPEGIITWGNPAFERLFSKVSQTTLVNDQSEIQALGAYQDQIHNMLLQLQEATHFEGLWINQGDDANVDEASCCFQVQAEKIQGEFAEIRYVLIFHDIHEEYQREKRLKSEANHDPLTGLLNRKAFEDSVPHLLARRNTPFALVFMDLNKFKPINDTYGHDVGDRVLCQVASRISHICRESDIFARFGGDEFVLFAMGVRNADDAQQLARKILSTFDEMIPIREDLSVQVGCSLGIVLGPQGENTLVELMRKADMAMYTAKESAQNHFHIYKEENPQ